MGDRQPRAQRERAAERVFGARLAVGRRLDVLADHAVAAAEVRPRRREARIQLEAALIQVARAGEPVVGARQLVRAQVELVGAGVVRRVGRRRRSCRPTAEARAPPTTRRAMSSCRRNRSPSDDWTVCDVSSVPPGASTSCAAARS